MASTVVDASALLALLLREPGAERFEASVGVRPVISAVNWNEVARKSAAYGVDHRHLLAGVSEAGLSIMDLTVDRAERMADLWAAVRDLGLSLADRACVALAVELGCPAVTADRGWSRLPIDGLEVRLLR